MTKSTHLTTVPEVIEALGGVPTVRELTEATSWQQVDNWRGRGRFPSRTYVVMTQALSALGVTADSGLWGMVGAKAQEPSAERSLTGNG